MSLDYEKKEELEIKIYNLIVKIVERTTERLDTPSGIINVLGEFLMFTVAVISLIDSLAKIVLELITSILNIVLIFFDKEIQVQGETDSILVAILCIVFLVIESMFCVWFVGTHVELKKHDI